MANAIPIRVPGTGGSTLEYVLPANMMQFVQSVNAVIDNSGGAVTKPTLTVLDSSNEVIADVPQGRSIPAGGAGRATWALGLGEESDGGITEVISSDPELSTFPPFGPVVSIGRFTIGAWIQRDGAGVVQNIPNDPVLGNGPTGLRHNVSRWTHGVTVNLAVNPSTLTIRSAGLYLFMTTTVWIMGNFPNAGLYAATAKTGVNEDTGSSTGRVIALTPNRVPSVGFARCAVGDVITQEVSQNTGGPIAAPQGSLMIYRLGPIP